MSARRHLREVGLGYFAHMGRALGYAGRLIGAGLACLIHAFLPGLFTESASRAVKALHRDMTEPHRPPAPAPILAAEAEA